MSRCEDEDRHGRRDPTSVRYSSPLAPASNRILPRYLTRHSSDHRVCMIEIARDVRTNRPACFIDDFNPLRLTQQVGVVRHRDDVFGEGTQGGAYDAPPVGRTAGTPPGPRSDASHATGIGPQTSAAAPCTIRLSSVKWASLSPTTT
jgi:hypothetical protein